MRLLPKSRAKPKPNVASRSLEFDAIGTTWVIELYGHIPDLAVAQLRSELLTRIETFDQTYSRFRSDSIVSEIARSAGTYTFPSDADELFALYRKIYDATAGAVTPFIGQLLADAGYDAAYSLKPGEVASPPKWDDVMSIVGTTLTTQVPVLLDFGAAGKGYLVDIVSELIEAAGISEYLVDAGGDIRIRRAPERALQIGLEHPSHLDEVIGVIALSGGSLCGSSGNRRKWAGYHHIMNPFTLSSPEHLAAVWVRAETTAVADALATGLFFAGADALKPLFKFEYALIATDGSLEYSSGFRAEFFTT